MSAETVPAEWVETRGTWKRPGATVRHVSKRNMGMVWKVTFEDGRHHHASTLDEAKAYADYQLGEGVYAILADRTIRPPEPNLPDAEAGESEAVAWRTGGEGRDHFDPASEVAAQIMGKRWAMTGIEELDDLRHGEIQAIAEAAFKVALAAEREKTATAKARIRSLEERLATAGEAMRRNYEGWRNAIELGLLPDQYVGEVRGLAELCWNTLASLHNPPPQPGVTHGDASQDGGAGR